MSASVRSNISNNNTGALIQREAWYRNPTLLWILKAAAINFVMPFFNGVMLGFGEILANEAIFKYGWFGYARPQLGINAIPASSTKDYRKSIEAQIKHEQSKEKDKLLRLD
ncbi:outer membrane protein TOM13-domain-containing protein [Parasitella parasitica]|nr:outer membrane protein TOM13-domain-containing protein [Parasitella parasitica]